jgi:glycerol-3-phosphate acyltransferase PlsX
MHRSILGGDLKGRYLGYAEGNDVLSGRFDVIVADGFTGNVALKLIEGVAFGLIGSIKKRLKQTTRGRVGGMLIKPAIRELMRGYDWRTHNGAPLLGVDGNVIIGHGKSDAVAVANAIDAAIRCAREDFPSILKRVLAGARRDFPDGYTKNLDK